MGKPGTDGPTSAAPGESNCVFCGNVGFYTTEDTIRGFFGQAGNVTSVRIAMGEDGRARGFCHVEFETPAEASEAMKLNGHEIDGRACRLDLSQNKKPSFGGGRGGFGDRGGRGGFNSAAVSQNKGSIVAFQGKKTTF